MTNSGGIDQVYIHMRISHDRECFGLGKDCRRCVLRFDFPEFSLTKQGGVRSLSDSA